MGDIGAHGKPKKEKQSRNPILAGAEEGVNDTSASWLYPDLMWPNI